ncbi:hypothetical protein [Halomonas huangheensis]|uniref:Uncharacterized protein n=1 Tax=Halomonas huangheensis TaxID=1178482 RepID=W1NC50_9GAMM|nr:hypothetical protein [Halomonas huangheensis]ALM54110.1 hypothetical protein AR456_18890 [Halomonas huangheensis]ERL52495.1 hypothetical protein BJB45_08055 [Halomonas huangheensis]
MSGLLEELYDVGFAQSGDVGDGLLAVLACHDPLVVAVLTIHSCVSARACSTVKKRTDIKPFVQITQGLKAYTAQ